MVSNCTLNQSVPLILQAATCSGPCPLPHLHWMPLAPQLTVPQSWWPFSSLDAPKPVAWGPLYVLFVPFAWHAVLQDLCIAGKFVALNTWFFHFHKAIKLATSGIWLRVYFVQVIPGVDGFRLSFREPPDICVETHHILSPSDFLTHYSVLIFFMYSVVLEVFSCIC